MLCSFTKLTVMAIVTYSLFHQMDISSAMHVLPIAYVVNTYCLFPILNIVSMLKLLLNRL
jgi:hypothetical protein